MGEPKKTKPKESELTISTPSVTSDNADNMKKESSNKRPIKALSWKNFNRNSTPKKITTSKRKATSPPIGQTEKSKKQTTLLTFVKRDNTLTNNTITIMDSPTKEEDQNHPKTGKPSSKDETPKNPSPENKGNPKEITTTM